MAHMDINLGDIADPNAPVAEGEYPLEIVEVEGTVSAKKGEMMLAWQHRISGDGPGAGKFVRDWTMLEGAGANLGLWKVRQYATACGVNLKRTTVQQIYDDPMKFFAGKIINAYLGIQIGEGEYSDRNTVERVLES